MYRYVLRYEAYVIRTGRDLASLVPELRRAVREVDPRLPLLDVVSMGELILRPFEVDDAPVVQRVAGAAALR